MELCAPHGSNKLSRSDLQLVDATHKLVCDVSLEIQLQRWRSLQLPAASTMDLYRLYERDLAKESAFCNWWSMWSLFGAQERLQMLRQVSLVAPAFSDAMLEVWYRKVACSVESLDSMD